MDSNMDTNRDIEIMLDYCLGWQWAKNDLKVFYRENSLPLRPSYIGSLVEYEKWGSDYEKFLEDEKQLKTAINVAWQKYRVAQIKTARWFPIETWLEYDSSKFGAWFIGLAVKSHNDFIFWCVPCDLVGADQLPDLCGRDKTVFLMTDRQELKRTLWHQKQINSICCRIK
jgi:hypothetical protein